MAVNLGRDVLKVDALSVPTSNLAQTDYIIIYNINVPYVYFNNPTSAVNVLTQIKINLKYEALTESLHDECLIWEGGSTLIRKKNF